MSHFIGGIQRLGHKVDPVDRSISGAAGLHMYHAPPVVPSSPSGDVAANSARDQQDFLKQRRGVLANIFGGGAQSAGGPAPTVATKTLLGS